MKKLFALLLAVMLVLTAAAYASEGAPASANVYVSITDGEGALVLAYEPVEVTDVDGDGALTINDALASAHAAKYEGGAEGYASVETEYGLSMSLLWGVENGSGYGYYLNNGSAWSLLDPVAEGDHVKAYVYTDLVTWSDTYCFFEANEVQVKAGEQLNLLLTAAGFDEAYAPITLPVEGAVITVNGEPTEVVTDAEGKAVISLTEVGTYVVSAVSEAQVLVAPVCVVTVTAE